MSDDLTALAVSVGVLDEPTGLSWPAIALTVAMVPVVWAGAVAFMLLGEVIG